jgi:uncharacterized damage-inducible protein DinB
MKVPELADALGAEKRALDALIRRLSVKQYETPAAGSWTVKDVLGHIAAYADAQRRVIATGVGRAREEPVYFEHYQPWNEEQYERRRTWRPQRIEAEVAENTARYLSLVKSLHEEELAKPIRFPWNEHGTIHELIVEGIEHQREHREQLSAILDRPA